LDAVASKLQEPGRYCSPRHRITYNPRNEVNIRWMPWREIATSAGSYQLGYGVRLHLSSGLSGGFLGLVFSRALVLGHRLQARLPRCLLNNLGGLVGGLVRSAG